MEWMLMPYRRYADFSGRSQRKEYWMFVLFEICVIFAGFLVMAGLASAVGEGAGNVITGLAAIVLLLFLLGSFIPRLAVTVRRLHDTDKSGWMILISFIPLLGIVLLVFLCSDGTRGDNRYGPDPKAGIRADIFS